MTVTPAKHRALFISDIHLGAKACQAEHFLEFLKHHDAETIYLVGDIVDFWRLQRTVHWPQSHNDVLQKLMRKASNGTRVVVLPGNHDERLRGHCGSKFGRIEIIDSLIHETADGRRILVIHGDQFDVVVRYARWLAFLGDWSYEIALGVNTRLNVVRRRLGLSYWSLSAYLKQRVKRAVNYIGDFEDTLAEEARRQGADGVICGHIHFATIRKFGEIDYMNTGDWVESCTAIAEHHDGTFEIIRWLDRAESKPAAAGNVVPLESRLKVAA